MPSDVETMIEEIDIGGCGAAARFGEESCLRDRAVGPRRLRRGARGAVGRGADNHARQRGGAWPPKPSRGRPLTTRPLQPGFPRATGETPPSSIFLVGQASPIASLWREPASDRRSLRDPRARGGPSLVRAEQVQGKELSYNNLTDADAAFELISEFPAGQPAIAIVKHANPCGAATGKLGAEAYRKALACDPVSAFGGIVALNQALDEEAAQEILRIFTEVVIAPSASEEAKKALSRQSPMSGCFSRAGFCPREKRAPYIRSVSGGFLVQDADAAGLDEQTMRTVTKREPTPEELADMLFAMRVAKHVKSNAIVFAKDGANDWRRRGPDEPGR